MVENLEITIRDVLIKYVFHPLDTDFKNTEEEDVPEYALFTITKLVSLSLALEISVVTGYYQFPPYRKVRFNLTDEDSFNIIINHLMQQYPEVILIK
jgi:hypothetical protein